MDESPLCGNLAETPFPKVLAAVWKKGLTGTLRVRVPAGAKEFAVEKGSLAVDLSCLQEKDFLKSLLTSGALDLISLSRVEAFAEEREVSLIRALLEIPFFGPGEAWKLLESYVKTEALLLFSEEDGAYEFEPGIRPGPVLLQDISIPALILEGVRGLKNPEAVAPHLPPETEFLQSRASGSSESLALAPHETYVLRSLGRGVVLSDLLTASELGKTETQRTLFALLCLGLARPRETKPKTGKTSGELSLSGLDTLFKAFNDKCAFALKYVTKEIGPVASNVIEKALDEIRPRLDPAFGDCTLQADGRIELKTPLRMSLSLAGEEGRKNLLRSMDEILMAEVLAVKRTLGPDHESVLVRSLEKIGEPG
jgi:hypothetical protein